MEDLEKVLQELQEVQRTFGIGAVILIIVFAVAIYFYAQYLIKRVKAIAQEESERNLEIFKTKHSQQVNAIHDCYMCFSDLNRFLHFMTNGDKYKAPMPIEKELEIVINLREKFINTFSQNRIVFTPSTCEKVDKLIPAIDECIEFYKDGLLPISGDEEMQIKSSDTELQIAGVWNQKEFEKVEIKLNLVQESIEDDFRSIYGTK